jgi:hypothetical protein
MERRPQTDERSGWFSLAPEPLPRPTYAPAMMAMGIAFVLWGVVTTFLISGVGLSLFGVAIAWWIGDLRHEHRQHEPTAE